MIELDQKCVKKLERITSDQGGVVVDDNEGSAAVSDHGNGISLHAESNILNGIPQSYFCNLLKSGMLFLEHERKHASKCRILKKIMDQF